jgi:hypothetical protein
MQSRQETRKSVFELVSSYRPHLIVGSAAPRVGMFRRASGPSPHMATSCFPVKAERWRRENPRNPSTLTRRLVGRGQGCGETRGGSRSSRNHNAGAQWRKEPSVCTALFRLFVFLCAPASWRFPCFGFVARASDAADAAPAVLEMFVNPKHSFDKRVRAKPTVPAHIHESPDIRRFWTPNHGGPYSPLQRAPPCTLLQQGCVPPPCP